MKEIDEHLRSDHLFLLVGTNPLPNWVAAKLLLNPGGRVHLFYTAGTKEQAVRLRKVLQDREKIAVSDYGTEESNEGRIYADVKKQAELLRDNSKGRIGLNYTGGTKMMAVHAHRAMFSVPNDRLALSYLDARSLKFKFDFRSDEPDATVQITIQTLLELHDEFRNFAQDVSHEQTAKCEKAASCLVQMHRDDSGQNVWRNWCDGLMVKDGKDRRGRDRWRKIGEVYTEKWKKEDKRKYDQAVIDLNGKPLMKVDDFSQMVESSLVDVGLTAREVALNLVPVADGYQKMLDALKISGGDTLETTTRNNPEFADSVDLAKWLDGLWLEHYAISQIQSRASATGIDPKCTAINLVSLNKSDRRFEADVIALRGYQLFYFSCYSGSAPETSKRKLFEAVTRAIQLGGDEAKAALICNHDSPKLLRQEYEADWELASHNRVRIFGRRHLPVLADELKDWFEGKPEK